MSLSVFTLVALLAQWCSAAAIPASGPAVSSPSSTHELARRQSNGTSIHPTRFDNVTWDNENWRLTTTALDQGHYQARASVANGYLGINVAAVGPFFEVDSPVDGDNINGWPIFVRRQTFATIAGFFDRQPASGYANATNDLWLDQYGDESFISGIPHWSGLIVDLGDGVYLDAGVDSTQISNFSSSQDYRSGTMHWQYTWAPNDSVSLDITFSLFAHKRYPTRAVTQLNITPKTDVNASIVNILDGTSAVRSDFLQQGTDEKSIYTSLSPVGVGNVTAFVYATLAASNDVDLSTLQEVDRKPYLGANSSSTAQAVAANLKAGQSTTITKFVGAASSDGFEQPKSVAKNGSLAGLAMGYDQMLSTHMAEWATVMPPDSVDDFSYPSNGSLPDDQYIIEAQIQAVVNPYYLLQNTLSPNALAEVGNAPIDHWSISVAGLTSDSYAGLVFWDAEIWMQPGLVAAFPAAAKQISNYRVALYEQAKANAQTSYTSSKNDTNFSSNAAVFPWTSGRFGNCTGTGPCFDYEYHINGDIAQQMSNYLVVTGDDVFFHDELLPVYDSIATFYSELLEKNGTKWGLSNLTDPVSSIDYFNLLLVEAARD